MTREEAISFLKNALYDARVSKQYLEAVTMARRSLEAWDKVAEDLYDYAWGFQIANRFDLSNVVINIMGIIEKHMKEVEDE